MSKLIKKTEGVSLISAVFVLVILGMVSGFMVSIFTMAMHGTTMSMEGSRAYFAARSGIEWGLRQMINDPSICPTPTTLTLTQGAVKGFSVQVSCTATPFNEGPHSFNIFEFIAVADNGTFTDNDYVSRKLRVVATRGT